MFREMRRKRQSLTTEEIAEVLRKGTSGVLALSGDDGYPYAVPISYVYDGDSIYFHCAKTGHKLDAIQRNAKASFCVIDQDQIVPEKYTTYFRSVIVFGKIRILTEDTEKRAAIEKLSLKYVPTDTETQRGNAIERDWKPLCMLEMRIEHMSGKEAIELAKKRECQNESNKGIKV